jgi:hypothetical protein
MYYRRNADSRLRSLERDLTISYTLDNLLAYNQELLRHGMPTVVAPPEFVRKALERLWWGRFSVWGIGDLQFPALEIKKNILDEAYPLLRPETLQQFKEIDTSLRSAIPLLLSLGWVALIKQCGKVTLRIKKDKEWGEYIVEWIEDKKHVNDDESYHTNGLSAEDKMDAEATMQHMLQTLHPTKYPELITVPRTVMEPSGRPITPQGAIFTVEDQPNWDLLSGRLLADQWAKFSDPRALTDPDYRRGSYPTAIILVERAAADSHRHHEVSPGGANYVTWQYYVPYDEGMQPSLGRGNYDMTLEIAKVNYLCRLLAITDNGNCQLFEA